MSFYRTYRPQVIDDIDNHAVREVITGLLRKEKAELPHAFLFDGPRGAGKTTAARVLAKLFQCAKPQKTGAPCGGCDHCRGIAEGRDIDVLELDAASNRGIDEIRALRDGIHLAPAASSYKIYIIDEVHMLTTEAFNALLKTLEEPPRHAIFILATTDPQKVPATVRSRCVTIHFGKATHDELSHALKRIAKAETIDITDEALSLIANHVDGSFRDAVKILEQMSFYKTSVTEDVVRSSLSLSSEATVSQFLEELVKTHDAQKAMIVIESLVQAGVDIKTFLTQCLSFIEQTLTRQAKDGVVLSLPFRQLASLLLGAYGEMKISPIPQLPLELAVVRFCEEQKTETPKAVNQPTSDSAKAHEIPQKEEENLGLLTLEKLVEHWKDIIDELKPYNHSVAGVLRSTRPKGVSGGIVTIEAFYKFHQEKLSEVKTREIIARVLKKLFGENVKVDVVLGKK